MTKKKLKDPADMTIEEVRAEIERITGRAPRKAAGDDAARHERYLRQRLVDFRARVDDGEDVRHRADSAVCSFSTTESAKAALEDVIAAEKKKSGKGTSMTKLTRAALAFWLEKNGYDEAADLIGGE